MYAVLKLVLPVLLSCVMSLYTAQIELVWRYEDLDIPGGGKRLKFGVVMYDDSTFATSRPAPTRLEGTVSPMHCAGAV